MGRKKSRSTAPEPSTTPVVATRPSSRRRWAWFLLVPLGLLLAGSAVFADWWTALPDEINPTYVGRQSCAECHSSQTHRWEGSHHDLAMDRATPDTVLADFDDAQFTHHGVESRMFRRDDRYFVHTEGPDGELADFEVKYVLGVTPLQQYMVEFDRSEDMKDDEIARLQVLRLSWDTEKKQWFYLAPPDVPEKLSPDDDLHWTGIAQRWNNMCADCHSTNLQKNHDPATNRYRTTFSEIDVSCESCHGPGSVHVELARSRSLFWDRKHGYGLARLKDKNTEIEIQSCAQCHARRRIVHPNYRPGKNYFDYYATELLQPHTYHPDGQILDEVYVHGSFLQSKMYHKSIRCTDCHDPHTAELKKPGNQLCTSCHAHAAGKYDSPSHHQHKPGSTGASCVECHMPETTYMAVDPRRDHSIRVPRPDLSVELGTPNACSQCHLNSSPLELPARPKLKQYADWLLERRTDPEVERDLKRLDTWAADATRKWYGEKKRPPHFASLLAAARTRDPDSIEGLARLATRAETPAIVRATAVTELSQFPGRESLAAAREALADPHPLVRAAAVAAFEGRGQSTLLDEVGPLLEDPVRVVRTEAARVLARIPSGQLSNAQQALFAKAIEEFEAGVMASSDRAAAHLTMGVLYEQQGAMQQAEDAYETAMRIEPRTTGPRSNLASLLERQAQQAQQLVQQAIYQQNAANRDQAVARVLELQKRVGELRAEELELLARDARLAPTNAWVQHRFGLASYLQGQSEQAEKALKAACTLEPEIPDFFYALCLLYQKQGRFKEALEVVNRLIQLRPRDNGYRDLEQALRRQARGLPPQAETP